VNATEDALIADTKEHGRRMKRLMKKSKKNPLDTTGNLAAIGRFETLYGKDEKPSRSLAWLAFGQCYQHCSRVCTMKNAKHRLSHFHAPDVGHIRKREIISIDRAKRKSTSLRNTIPALFLL